MRELAFTLTYEPGCNAVADTLAAHPSARVHSLSLHVTPERLWRVDHVTGPEDALVALEETFATADYYADCLATDHCGAEQETQVLDRDDETLVLYSYWERTPACASVPHIALDHLGAGALFETRQSERAYRWRILHQAGGDVRAFLDALEAAVDGCAGLQLDRLREAGPPQEETDDELPPAQAEALRLALEAGYYETPRRVDVSELAERTGIPRSTLNYRLRRAEAHLAAQHVGEIAPEAAH